MCLPHQANVNSQPKKYHEPNLHRKYSQAPQSLDLRAAYADLFEKH